MGPTSDPELEMVTSTAESAALKVVTCITVLQLWRCTIDSGLNFKVGCRSPHHILFLFSVWVSLDHFLITANGNLVLVLQFCLYRYNPTISLLKKFNLVLQ